MKHKHAELIHAWADGAEIQAKAPNINKWINVFHPSWDDCLQYRIKPEEKAPVVRWLWAKQVIGGEWTISPVFRSEEEASKTFDGQFICLEWSRQEFPE